jgi:hypothetical protein
MAQATKTPEGTPFSIHVVGDVTGKTWAGAFRAKPGLSFRDKLNSDRMRRELLGNDAASATTESHVTATVISALSVRLTEAPEWWTEAKGGLELQDFNVLEEVYKKSVEVEDAHTKKVEDEGKAAGEKLREPEKK